MSRKLASFVYVNGVAYGPDDDVPAEVAKAITNPKAWAGDGPVEDPEDEGYDGLKVADLRAEIASRNEGRDDDAQIVPAGTTKADLVAALEADDAAASDDQ